MPEINVQELPPKERYWKIMNAFESLEAGEAPTLIKDHDTKPPYYELQAECERSDAEKYELAKEGPDRFVATLPKQ